MDKAYLKRVKEVIREARKDKGLTQEEVAEKIGIHLNSYQKIESGGTDIKLTHLVNIMVVLELSFDYLQGSLPLKKEDDEASDFFNKMALLQQASNEAQIKKMEALLDQKMESNNKQLIEEFMKIMKKSNG